MTDQELVLDALTKANLVVSEYIEPGPRNALATLDALILLLQDQALGDAVERLEQPADARPRAFADEFFRIREY